MERQLEKIIQVKELINSEDKIKTYVPIYNGLKLIEDKSYKGGTSIKYWM